MYQTAEEASQHTLVAEAVPLNRAYVIIVLCKRGGSAARSGPRPAAGNGVSFSHADGG
jgi:hypothetical protein